ncbi:MAG: hypothetical protein ABMB14_05180 [Myxococcota bacterium]
MSPTFELLMVAALIGAADVLYFHLYRFRLYAQPGSVAEEVTHLVRHVLFLGIVLVMLVDPPLARPLVVGLFAVDQLNNGIDVLLERSSRAPLGGLRSGEYLVHVASTLLTGMAIATFWWAPTGAALSPIQLARGWATVGLGAALFATEATWFARALASRRTRTAAA